MLGNEFDRYTTKQMSQVWSPDWKFRRWAEIETAVAEAQGAPSPVLARLRGATVPSAQAVATEEAKTRHDVIAFLNLWRGSIADEDAISWTHRGLTSSDIVDTANGLRFKATTDAVRASLTELTRAVGQQALDYRHTLRVGRTHGQHAEVTTWGWRLAVFFYDLTRAERRLSALSELYEVGKLSGPVGDYKNLTPAVELEVLQRLGLHGPGASTQIITRDVYVDYVFALSQIANVIENLATEIRLASRTEVAEMREGTLASQRGSSAMPHKRNPITSEQLCGLARVVRAQVAVVAQWVAVHHECDISHSSAERLALALASQVTDYMLETATRLVRDLRVYPERMRANAQGNLDLLSSLIKNHLTEVVGISPTDAYEVTFWAFDAWSHPDHSQFDTLSDALGESWHKLMVEDRNVLIDPPDWEEVVGLGDNLDNLVGQTAPVFIEIEFFLKPDVPF